MRLPVRLVYSEVCRSASSGLNRERQIKRWTRAKKEALIAGNCDLLRRLSPTRRRGALPVCADSVRVAKPRKLLSCVGEARRRSIHLVSITIRLDRRHDVAPAVLPIGDGCSDRGSSLADEWVGVLRVALLLARFRVSDEISSSPSRAKERQFEISG
jgi:hypothetical protein